MAVLDTAVYNEKMIASLVTDVELCDLVDLAGKCSILDLYFIAKGQWSYFNPFKIQQCLNLIFMLS